MNPDTVIETFDLLARGPNAPYSVDVYAGHLSVRDVDGREFLYLPSVIKDECVLRSILNQLNDAFNRGIKCGKAMRSAEILHLLSPEVEE